MQDLNGDDSISPEVMKSVHNALCDGLIPDQWKLSNIVPVPKKVDLTKTDNYK